MEDVNARGGEEQPPQGLDEFHEVQRQVIEALDRGDALHEEAARDGQIDVENDTSTDTADGLEGFYTEATTPVYPGSKMSVVLATIIIMNMCYVFRVSNTFTDELFCFMFEDLLPTPNKLARNHYAARKSIRRLGLHYNNIHACPNGCILYDDEHASFDRCPKCTQPRWVDGTNNNLKLLHEILSSE